MEGNVDSGRQQERTYQCFGKSRINFDLIIEVVHGLPQLLVVTVERQRTLGKSRAKAKLAYGLPKLALISA